MVDSQANRFVELLLRHQSDLLRFIVPLVGELQDAQDVLQETAKALWQKFDQYDSTQSFLAWAKQFARNEVLMHHRRKRRFTFLSPELLEQLADDQDREAAPAQARREALASCLQKLSPRDRNLLDQRYARNEATVQQIAAETGQTANALYKSLGRIRTTLLACIERHLAMETSG